jgi:hypothetical protein
MGQIAQQLSPQRIKMAHKAKCLVVVNKVSFTKVLLGLDIYLLHLHEIINQISYDFEVWF